MMKMKWEKYLDCVLQANFGRLQQKNWSSTIRRFQQTPNMLSTLCEELLSVPMRKETSCAVHDSIHIQIPSKRILRRSTFQQSWSQILRKENLYFLSKNAYHAESPKQGSFEEWWGYWYFLLAYQARQQRFKFSEGPDLQISSAPTVCPTVLKWKIQF